MTPAVRTRHSNRSTLTPPGTVCLQIVMPDVGTAKPLKFHAYRVKELGNTLEAVTLFHVSPSDFLVEPLSGTALERPTIAEAGGHVAPYPGRSGAHRLHSNPMDPRSLGPA